MKKETPKKKSPKKHPRDIAPGKTRKWTPKFEKFCHEFMLLGNATQAYKNAKLPGWQTQHACDYASRFRRRSDVESRIVELSKAANEKADVETVRVLKEDARIAFCDPAGIMKNGNILPLDEIPEDTRRAVASYKVTDTILKHPTEDNPEEVIKRVIEVKFWDKGASLERLEKYLGLFMGKGETLPIVFVLQGHFGKPVDAGMSAAFVTPQLPAPQK